MNSYLNLLLRSLTALPIVSMLANLLSVPLFDSMLQITLGIAMGLVSLILSRTIPLSKVSFCIPIILLSIAIALYQIPLLFTILASMFIGMVMGLGGESS